MRKFRPTLRTVIESGNHKKQRFATKLQDIQRRYSHIPNTRSNRNTLYVPKPILKRTKQNPIQPSGNSWNLMIEELKRPMPKKTSYRKYTESMKPVRPVHSKLIKPLLKHRITTKNENIRLLQKEVNRSKKNHENRLDSPKGIKI